MGHLTPRKPDLDLLVVGAGPTGLAMAAEAARFGLRYRIIDRRERGAEHSQAVVVHSRTLEQFERYEIAQRAIELGRRLTRIRIYSDGRPILETDLSEITGSYPFILFLPQTQTEALLMEHLEGAGGRIERLVQLESFVDGVDGVECELVHAGGRRETVTAAYLAGCDGAQSTVRRLLSLPANGVNVAYDFFLGDLRVDGDVPGDELNAHLHHGNLVFIGRLDDTHCRLIVTLRDHPSARHPELADFQYALDLCGVENLRVSDPRWMTSFHVSERRAAAYSSGRVFLAGDATNVHSPVGGQGMNAGIQDAANLVWKIALVHCGRAAPELLESYDRERKTIGEALLRSMAGALRVAMTGNWMLERLRDGLLPRIAGLPGVQQRAVNAMAELGLSYRSSPIVLDRGGASGLRAGDRAPDCEAVDETGTTLRLFDLYKEPVHTALLVTPAGDDDVNRFAALTSTYRDVLQGRVICDGDAEFKRAYAQPNGALYAIRPDGYAGFRSRASDVDSLEKWLRDRFTE